MKHSIKITIILLSMFLLTQFIGLIVINIYSPEITQTTDSQGNPINITTYNLPYGMEPPQDISPPNILFSIIIAIVIAAAVMFILMKYNAEVFLRIWFFIVVTLAIGITLNAFLIKIPNSSYLVLAVSLPLAFFKIFKRNILIHNFTELIVYPGIASIFVPLLTIWTVVLLLILISLYDMYAVWHSGFMQKMAQYQIQRVKVFTGFFIPYLGEEQKQKLAKLSKSQAIKQKNKKIKVNVAILGGGDVVFPIILAGVVLVNLGVIQAVFISLGATLALAGLFKISEKGKFYPAMPFITTGCLIALALAYLI